VFFYGGTVFGQIDSAKAEKYSLLNTINSQASAIYGLARERYVFHKNNGEVWILNVRVEVAGSIKKFREGKFVIASIPVLSLDQEGVLLYANHYNALVLEEADRMILAEKYEMGIKTYKLLQRFGDLTQELKATLDRRIECAKKIEKNEQREVCMAELKRFTADPSSSSIFEQLEGSNAIAVTNLFDIPSVLNSR
jgi:hypothetical protein